VPASAERSQPGQICMEPGMHAQLRWPLHVMSNMSRRLLV